MSALIDRSGLDTDNDNFGGESSDFIFVLGLKVLRFGTDDFLLKLRNFLLLGRDSSGLCLDVTLGLHDFVSDDRSLSSVFFRITEPFIVQYIVRSLTFIPILPHFTFFLFIFV